MMNGLRQEHHKILVKPIKFKKQVLVIIIYLDNMKYYKSENLATRFGDEGTFIKVNGKEKKTTEKDAVLFGGIVSEGEEISKKEYDAI